MERGKKSDKKWRDAHTFKAEQEAIRAKEVAEYTERKKEESRQIQKRIEAGNSKLTKLQEAIDELLSATSVPEEELEAVPFADMTFSFQGSKEPLTVKDLIDMTLLRLDREIRTPIPMLKREEWQKERNAKAKEIVTTLQSQLLSVSKLHKKKINDVGKKMYLDVKQKIALAVETDKENMALRQRISELDERAVARERSRADAAEQKAQEQTMRGNREEKRANEAESRLSDIERFIRLSGASEAYEHWNFLHSVVEKAAQALADWAHSTASISNHDGYGKCYDRQREYHGIRRITIGAEVCRISNIYLVYDVVKRSHQKRDDAWYRIFPHQALYRFFSEIPVFASVHFS
jgi:hypothetical protein